MSAGHDVKVKTLEVYPAPRLQQPSLQLPHPFHLSLHFSLHFTLLYLWQLAGFNFVRTVVMACNSTVNSLQE